MKTLNASLLKRLNRAELKLSREGDQAAIRYLIAAIPNSKSLNNVMPNASAPLKPLIQEAIVLLDERHSLKQQKIQDHQHKLMEEIETKRSLERLRIEKLRNDLGKIKDEKGRAIFIAGLEAEDRKNLGSPTEIKLAAELRKQCILASDAISILGCTPTEFKRWTDEGRIPHLFIKKIRIAKWVEARFWLPEKLDIIKPLLDTWRKEWEICKRDRRSQIKIAR